MYPVFVDDKSIGPEWNPAGSRRIENDGEKRERSKRGIMIRRLRRLLLFLFFLF